MLNTQLNRFILPLVGGLVAIASFSSEGSAYLFPHTLAISLVVMALADGVLEFLKSKAASMSSLNLRALSLGLLFIFLYVIFSEAIGFYLGGLIFMLAMIGSYLWLQNQEQQTPFRFIKHLVFVITFCVVMYFLFTIMLKVQIPTGLWL